MKRPYTRTEVRVVFSDSGNDGPDDWSRLMVTAISGEIAFDVMVSRDSPLWRSSELADAFYAAVMDVARRGGGQQ